MLSNKSQTKERMVDNIKRLVREKGDEISKIKLSNKNAIIANKWSLPKTIFADGEQDISCWGVLVGPVGLLQSGYAASLSWDGRISFFSNLGSVLQVLS